MSQALELVRILDLAASYNDKGIVWSGHTEAKAKQMREVWQSEINSILPGINQESIPGDLAAALNSGAAVEDSKGTYVSLARTWAQGMMKSG